VSTDQPEGDKSYLWFLALGLGLYCIVLTAITGDIGFSGDDWWVLACPYWNGFWDSLVLYAHKFQRPVEGLYWIGLFKLFGFNKVAFHLCSLLLLAGSAILMGLALDRAFPDRPTCISIAVLLAFFLPSVSCLTYVMFTDNSRLSMLLFWLSVLAFQRWARNSSQWGGLALPMTLYLVSFLTYETSSFLIFVIPLLAWPVHRRYSVRPTDRVFLTKIGASVVAAFLAAIAVRCVFLNGGAVRTSFLLPPFELIWSYLGLLPFYLVSPFTSMSADLGAILVSCLVVLGSIWLFFFLYRGRPEAAIADRIEPRSQWSMVVLGGGIFVLGMLPYQLAGYGSFAPRITETLMTKCGLMPYGDLSWFNFTWASRIYSSASFGVAILLAFALTGWRHSPALQIGKVVALVIIGFMTVFHAGLSQDWREAAEIRNNLVRNLISEVPAVKPGTNLVFLDIACSHKRVEVIRRENGLAELVQMLYSDRTLGAWRLYTQGFDRSSQRSQQATATPQGFLSCPGQRQCEIAPPESLLLFKRSGRILVLLDQIAAEDGSVPTGIAWRGIEHLSSNLDRIEVFSSPLSPRARLASAPWTTGLISTLQLTQLRSTLASLGLKKYVALDKSLRRHLFRMRSSQFRKRL
jgi:hypothetical protein